LAAAAMVASFVLQLDRDHGFYYFFHSPASPRQSFHSFVSLTAGTAAAVVSFICQLDGQERTAEGGTWPMK
jgi:hypothetical protein